MYFDDVIFFHSDLSQSSSTMEQKIITCLEHVIAICYQVWLPSLPYKDWMSPVWATAHECGFTSSVLNFFKTYSTLQTSLEKTFTSSGRSHNHTNNLNTLNNFEELRTCFVSILGAESLPNSLRVHFISRACRVQELHPEVFCSEDRIFLAAQLDYASNEDPRACQSLHKYRVQLCGITG